MEVLPEISELKEGHLGSYLGGPVVPAFDKSKSKENIRAFP